jgi:hypothetical protein
MPTSRTSAKIGAGVGLATSFGLVLEIGFDAEVVTAGGGVATTFV